MKRVTSLIVLSLLLSIAVVPVHAQQARKGDLKVGYVDLNAVLEEYQPYQKATERLEQFRDDIQSQIDEDRQRIEQLRSELQDGEFLSEDQQRQKQQQLQERMRSFQQSRQRSQQMMQRQEQQLLQPVRAKVREAVELTADELDYDVVHRFGGRQPSTVLWVSAEVDMTDEVIDRLSDVGSVEVDTPSGDAPSTN